MSKVTLNSVGNLIDATTARAAINANSAAIQVAFDNTVSRDGSSPNQMNSNFDMNSHRILNLPDGVGDDEPVTVGTFNAAVIGEGNVPIGGNSGQVLAKNSGADYDTHWINTLTSAVTSVGLSLPADFVVTGSPVTTIGTLGGDWATPPTGTGALVRATSPTLVTPALGTPASGVATNLTGTASGLTAGHVTTNANLTGDVTSSGNATTLATVNSNVGTFGDATHASQVTVNGKGLVTAASSVVITGTAPGGSAGGDLIGTYPNPTLKTIPGLTASGAGSATVIPIFTWDVNGRITTAGAATATPAIGSITGLGTNVSAFLATPTSANLASAVTNETGTGALVFATSPALVTPTGIVKGDVGLGNVDNTSDATKNSAVKTLTNTTYDTAGTGNSFSINGVAATANTGTGSVVRATSPTLVTPVLGAATATTINGAALDNLAWTTYSPTVTSATPGGTPATYTVNFARYKQIGKTVFVATTVTVTNQGVGAAGNMVITLPFTASSATAATWTGNSREYSLTGKGGFAWINTGGTAMECRDATNVTYIATGNIVTCTVMYEIP